ncbi:sensor histidine kinase [Paraurantiacibacter namhicola]|uniref:histidine kinase n=1 Tax=Paraurantiacibacter namhicola TaxID=645517 RepID=A0A1C7D9B5_9SPHN|nr:HAMP domain-containing sensor histidine kinase [Paraurantiacibacter namhicola]ANU08079.1 Non-motile and phage-resistance protein [Paraurantiacibacter namhicola]
MSATVPFLAQARTDGQDRLVEADEPLAGLQLRNGGELPGRIATPALLELVRKCRRYGMKLARAIEARDSEERITAWVEVEPDEAGDGCTIGLANWRTFPLPKEDQELAEERRIAIERQVAEFGARLGPDQEVQAVTLESEGLAPLAEAMRGGRGRPWTDFVDLPGFEQEQPMHWRLLDGAAVSIPGSSREWKAVLVPLGRAKPGSQGFELFFSSVRAPEDRSSAKRASKPRGFNAAIGKDIAPVLRQPIARIIANAETIRTQLAGPLADEYSNYAADIAQAGEHLLALLEDLSTLEIVEADEFSTAPDEIDLADVARRAAGILSVRARDSGITIDAPKQDESVAAVGEFRRVLQILLNLLGNALRYAPEESQVWLRAEQDGKIARITVADQGEGLDEDQQEKVFEKFERLGRSGDGGSGLGLYISRRLARAMGGDLTVESAKGQGARFTLSLPVEAS